MRTAATHQAAPYPGDPPRSGRRCLSARTMVLLTALCLALAAPLARAVVFTLPGVDTDDGPFEDCTVTSSGTGSEGVTTISCPDDLELGNNDSFVVSNPPVILEIAGNFEFGNNFEANVGGSPTDLTIIVGGDLDAGNGAEIVANLVVGGDLELGNNGAVTGDVSADGDVELGQNITIDGDLSGDDIEIDGSNTVINGDVAAAGELENSGTINGNASAGDRIENEGTIDGDANAPEVDNDGTIGGTICDTGSPGACPVPVPEVVAEYLFEDAPFTGTVTDSSGNGFTGSAEGATTTALVDPAVIGAGTESSCRYGSFPGGDSGVSVGNVDLGIGGTTELTVMAWVRWRIPPGTGDSWANLVTANSSGDTGQFWLQHRQDNGVHEFAVQTSGGRTFVQSSVATQQDVWQHVAGVYDGSTIRIFVDGVQAGQVGRTGPIRAFDAATELNIGRWKPAGRRFTGDIDEVRVIAGVLDAGEIMAFMQQTRPCPDLFPNLLIAKSSSVLSDTVNGANNPKRIPGALVRYSIQVTNLGAGRPDADSLSIDDALPPGVLLRVPGSGDAITFTDGATANGLSFDFATDVGFSTAPDGEAPFDHDPVDDGTGVDPAVTGLRIRPGGRMNGHDGIGTPPSFTVSYQLRLE